MSYNYLDYYSVNKKKYKWKWAFNLFFIQIIMLVIWWILVWQNYGQITKADSHVEKYTSRHHITEYEQKAIIKDEDDEIWYKWYLGKVYMWIKKNMKWSQNFVETKTTKISIDINNIKRVLYAQHILNLWYIDWPTFHYLIKQDKTNFDIILNDFSLLWKMHNITMPLEPNTNNDLIGQIQWYLDTQNYKKLVYLLKSIDDTILISLRNVSESKKILDANFLKTDSFSYLLDKIYIDKLNFYKSGLDTASNIFWLNENIIRSAILTEQMRAAFTYRGRIKQIMATDTYLMVMSQSSYGIWWVKAATAEKLEDYLKQQAPELYNKYFSFPVWSNIYNVRFSRLTDTKNYTYQINYIGWLFYKYINTWADGGVDISNSPWVLLTLYNIWDKIPNKNPSIGGSTLNIEWESFTFGKLWMLLYYYLEIYGDSLK